MAFYYRKNTNNLLIFIFVFITNDILLISVQSFKRSRFDVPERFDNKLTQNEYKSLVHIYNPVDIGSGTPDIMPPDFLRFALMNLSRSLDASVHQYTPFEGSLELRKEIAGLYSTLINRTLDPTKNIMVTLGATEAMYLTLLLHTLPGEEWILIEPAYEVYYAMIKMTGGTVRPIRLKSRATRGKFDSADLVLDEDELKKAFNPRTKGIIVNNPNNPTGKIFTKEELLFIARLATKWDTLIISDEVYEWTIFDSNHKHIRMASLGHEIFSRTITTSSMSKTYFATGWRVGWAIGPSELIGNLIYQQPFLVICSTTYAQLAAAKGLRKMRHELGHPDSYFIKVAKSLERKRNFMVEVLNKIGMESIVPQAGYYVFANWTKLESRCTGLDREKGNFRDIKFVKWLIKNARTTVVPGSAHYDRTGKNIEENFVRICYAKKFETLQRAATSLLKQFSR